MMKRDSRNLGIEIIIILVAFIFSILSFWLRRTWKNSIKYWQIIMETSRGKH